VSEPSDRPFTFSKLGEIKCFHSHFKVHYVATGSAIIQRSRVLHIHDCALILLAIGLNQPEFICGCLTYVGEASENEDTVFEVGFTCASKFLRTERGLEGFGVPHVPLPDN
jgi:hypothetical protein